MIKAIQITYEMPKGKGSSKLLEKYLNQILLIKTESFEDACLKHGFIHVYMIKEIQINYEMPKGKRA